MRTAWVLQGLGFLILGTAVYVILEKTPGNETTSPEPSLTSTNSVPMNEDRIIIRSPAFLHEHPIPSKYTCDGENLSPPLAIDNIPTGTVSLALIMDDPDAPSGNWDHWISFNIDPGISRIGEGSEPKGTAGNNSWEETTYGGPCPPNGTHRYYFTVFALDTQLRLSKGAEKEEILEAMQGHILSQGELMGTYKRLENNT